MLLVLGTICLVSGLNLTKKQTILKTWVKTTGVVLDSRITTYYKYITLKKPVLLYFRLEVIYEYKVENKIYRSNKVGLLGDYESSSKSEIERLHNEYKKGDKIIVYYNPENQSQSILIKDDYEGAYFASTLLFVGITSLGLLLFIFVSYIREFYVSIYAQKFFKKKKSNGA